MTNSRKPRKAKLISPRTYYSYPWAMYTKCKQCGEIKYCRGKSRERMKCAHCTIGDAVE